MLQIYDLGSAATNVSSSSKMASIYIDKLHELGLCQAYDSSAFTFNSNNITGTQEIQFKDNVKAQLVFFVPSGSSSYPEYTSNSKRVLFVDEENHFILCSTAASSFLNTKTNENMQYYIHAMCGDDWYGKNIIYMPNQSTSSQAHFNIPTVALTNNLDDKFTLYPLYMVPEKAVIKNVYFSPDKTYPVGTVMTDSAGNQFASLVPRFFYKMN